MLSTKKGRVSVTECCSTISDPNTESVRSLSTTTRSRGACTGSVALSYGPPKKRDERGGGGRVAHNNQRPSNGSEA